MLRLMRHADIDADAAFDDGTAHTARSIFFYAFARHLPFFARFSLFFFAFITFRRF